MMPAEKKIKSKALKIESGKEKRRRVQNIMPIRSLFDKLPDEMVLTILSYGEMVDIQNTRGWQSKNVQHCTETKTRLEAAKDYNLDNLKWIYDYIGDTKFKSNFKEDDYEFDEVQKMIPMRCTGI